MRRAGGARFAHHRTTQAMPPKSPKTKNQKPKTKKAAISGFLSQAKNKQSANAKKTKAPDFTIKAPSKIWGGRWESNPRQPESQSGALPTELRPPYCSVAVQLTEAWCGRRDSNSYSLRRWNLNPVCLPISPRPLLKLLKQRRQTFIRRLSKYGVDDGDRTHDNRSHNPVLYQLSYAHHIALLVPKLPNGAPGRTRTCDHPLRRRMLYPAELRALI